MNRLPLNQRNAPVRPVYDRTASKKLVGMFIAGIVLTVGFVLAARQHFKAVRLGYETETLRREQDRLEEEQHHLLLIREQAAAPSRLETAARNLGLRPLVAAQIEVKNNGVLPGPDPAAAKETRPAPQKKKRN